MFYQLLSRATTIGHPEDKLSSAINFDGNNFNQHRFENLTMKNEKEMYKMASLRKQWVDYLRHNIQPRATWSKEEMNDLFHWANSTVISSTKLNETI